VEPPTLLRGSAHIGRRTVGAVRWEIAPSTEGSRVAFTAVVERASLLDRVLLTSGGRWWLVRIVRSAVASLGDAIEGN
jgi:hypothetical protein